MKLAILALIACAATQPARADDVPHDQRLGAMGIFSPVTGQDDTIAVWAGALYGHSLFIDELWGYLGIGYVAVGEAPGTGRDAIAPLLGLEVNIDLVSRLEVLGRAALMINRPTTEPDVNPWILQDVAVSAQLGLRFWFVEVFFAAGSGPADGANVGVGAALSFPFGGSPEGAAPGESRLF